MTSNRISKRGPWYCKMFMVLLPGTVTRFAMEYTTPLRGGEKVFQDFLGRRDA